MIGINESALTFVQSPYIQNLVTIDSCKDYIESTANQNLWLRIIAFVAVALMFYWMYKQGKFNKEKKALKELGGEEHERTASNRIPEKEEKESDTKRDPESDEGR